MPLELIGFVHESLPMKPSHSVSKLDSVTICLVAGDLSDPRIVCDGPQGSGHAKTSLKQGKLYSRESQGPGYPLPCSIGAERKAPIMVSGQDNSEAGAEAPSTEV